MTLSTLTSLLDRLSLQITEPRGHELKLFKPQVSLDARKYFLQLE